MSRVFEALRRSEAEGKVVAPVDPTTSPEQSVTSEITTPVSGLEIVPKVEPHPERESRIVMLDDPSCLAAEKFRVLAGRLQHMQQERPALSVLVITSSSSGDGKSTVAANLAVALGSRSAGRVALVDGDLRIPSQAAMWGIWPTAGLGECLQSDKAVSDFMVNFEAQRVCLLPAGAAQEFPPGLLQTPRLKEVVDELRRTFSWVIIDAPPLLPLADTNLIARYTDGAILVARQDKTVKKELKQAITSMGMNKILGLVMNASDVKESNYYYSRYAQQAGKKTRSIS
jgi:capsular exopolysaccharide synthesis family protein